MAVNTNISNWIDRAESAIDYYSLFIKTWIPFNAWYMHNYYDDTSNPKRDTDAAIINHINSTTNIYRDKIKSLLRGSNESSVRFKLLLGKLHSALEANSIPDYENRISFSTICLSKNSFKTHSQSLKTFTYFVEFKDQYPKLTKRWFLEVQKRSNNQTIHRVELFNWSLTELQGNDDFNAIPEQEKRDQLRDAFQKINPKKPITIIIPPKIKRSNPTQPSNSIVIDPTINLYFTNDHDLVSKVIVQMIYELRCKLFHGELNPNDANSHIYEFAYEIQKTLIKELN
ncbi:MAG: hypothetical protein JNK00_05250 [Flavipsychrobacter sp.]|nr:hypothetical protein [Flavipsychrobacter sp.]